MTTQDELLISDLLRRCDFSHASAQHRSALREKLLNGCVELDDDDLGFVAAAGNPDQAIDIQEFKRFDP